MKTPFDTVLRLRRREIDETRIALHTRTAQLAEIDRDSEALEQELARERKAFGESWSASAEAFIKRRKFQHAQLAQERATISQDVDRLRQAAIDAHGSQHVLETAVEAFRADHDRRMAQAAQRETDDLCAARHTSSFRQIGKPEPLRPSTR
ncbi:hypothetical protein [Pseudoblastomonas halimionae]|uniref:Flagellar FliJ protein n=1 Tax=Alteriqipengyuania halimionae TaxID=1926630 RepID=A0A6I4U6C3_9SPHN|nr:hypothetical protein [Alteriqipengyuania halimionae]MXP10413.1 hypothetical protein [Alteriqipengyuania halimionae]